MATEETTSEFERWAEEEVRRAGLFDADSDYDGMLGPEIMRLVHAFAGQGHSGMSAALVASIFAQLSQWKPLTPITNDPDEWMLVDDAGWPNQWQSRRCPSAFSNDGGITYYDIEDDWPWWRKALSYLRRKPVYKLHRADPHGIS